MDEPVPTAVLPANDITYHIQHDDAPEALRVKRPKPRAAFETHDCIIRFPGKDLPFRRALVCSCFDGQQIAITARKTDRYTGESSEVPEPPGYPNRKALEEWPADRNSPDAQRNEENNGKSIDTIFRYIEQHNRGHWRGMLIFAGETGSRKTTYLKGICRRYISKLLGEPKGSRPHIVTYEDPIESWFAVNPADASNAGFEYTPRQRGVDVSDLERATTDALRQRPAMFVVNEVRRRQDWKALLEFAGTGHFAITTTHAGSLTETFERIMTAAGANTPARRSGIASRIIAIVHLKQFGAEDVLPSMWLGSAQSRTAFIQDGLASLLPNADGCYGREGFAKQLGLEEALVTEALKEDLRGR